MYLTHSKPLNPFPSNKTSQKVISQRITRANLPGMTHLAINGGVYFWKISSHQNRVPENESSIHHEKWKSQSGPHTKWLLMVVFDVKRVLEISVLAPALSWLRWVMVSFNRDISLWRWNCWSFFVLYVLFVWGMMLAKL